MLIVQLSIAHEWDKIHWKQRHKIICKKTVRKKENQLKTLQESKHNKEAFYHAKKQKKYARQSRIVNIRANIKNFLKYTSVDGFYLFSDCLSSLIFCWVMSPLEKSKTSSLNS